MSRIVGSIFSALCVFCAIVLGFLCTTKVPAGYVAVQYNMNGGVKDDVLTQGWHLVPPTVHTTNYTIGLEQSYLTAGKNGDSKNDESFSACSSEGKDVSIDLTFTYQFKAEDVKDVFVRFKGQSGNDVRDSFIKPNIVSWTKEVIARYKVADILGSGRAGINQDLTNYLSERFAPYGITISNVSLINIEVDEDTAQAINNKITAQQNAETQAINNQTAIDKATAEAEVKRTKAQAEADAILIEAEAQAEANRKLIASLDDSVLEKNWIEKWDGRLPTYMSGDASIPVLNSIN